MADDHSRQIAELAERYGRMVFATLITLVLVPSLYLLIDDAKRTVTRLHRVLFP